MRSAFLFSIIALPATRWAMVLPRKSTCRLNRGHNRIVFKVGHITHLGNSAIISQLRCSTSSKNSRNKKNMEYLNSRRRRRISSRNYNSRKRSFCNLILLHPRVVRITHNSRRCFRRSSRSTLGLSITLKIRRWRVPNCYSQQYGVFC